MPEYIPKTEELKEEETFKEYIENLQLGPEDFKKKILDVGSGEGGFSSWTKKHFVSNNIFSLDRFNYKKNGEIRLAPVANWKTIDVLKDLVANFSDELASLEKDKKIEVKRISLGEADYGIDGFIEQFLYKIKKL